ncbi:MAG: hypothetical protein R3296_00900 [Oleiphilaceae bacterium]|nr:hypothetical protein [Oleiphilaceae bacterium]
MLAHGNQIRLTPRERKVLRRITGIDPHFIRTRESLQRFTEQYLDGRRTDSPEIRMIKVLLRKHILAE